MITLPITIDKDVFAHTIDGISGGVTYTVTMVTYNAGGEGPSISETVITQGNGKYFVYVYIYVSYVCMHVQVCA